MKGLKRLLLASVLCAGCAQTTWAIGAYPHPIKLRQPDGTTLMVRIQGDENFHFVTTTDGFLLQKNKKGFFCYVDYDEKSRKKTTTKQRAHNVDERTDKEKVFVKSLASASQVTTDILSHANIVKKAPNKLLSRSIVAPQTTLGTRASVKESQYLVVLVNFQDSVMRHTQQDFDHWLNQPGYSENGGTGSVKDYYRDNSMGQFVPNFQVVGPYTLSHETAYYGGNSSTDSGTDTNPRDMVKEAVELAKKNNPDLDFKQFDNDGDGIMDNCYVIYAGYSEASTANANDIWPHSWYLEDGTSVDGIQIHDYSCSAELVGMPSAPVVPSMDGIGTFTHEFGHVLGLKDMYDTDSETNGNGIDPGAYSLYASGSYNNSSHTPPCLMAFERLQLGWMKEGEDIVEVKNPEDVDLATIANNKARFINCQPDRKPGTGMEWFILENRQQTGWDKYIPGHGLLITHYDYTDEMKEKWWDVNGPNNSAKHRCMYIVPADGIDNEATRSGDTYPGKEANTSFTDTTTPNSLNWANEPVNVPITNIMEEDGTVRFQVSGGTSKWNFIKTLVPTSIFDTKATFKANVESHNVDIDEIGFCWKEGSAENPSLEDAKSGHGKVSNLNELTLTVTDLQPGTAYSVRSYMKMSDGSVVYGSPLPFTTEWPYANVTIDNPFYCDFKKWTDGNPDGWKIVDHNGDGTTWYQDETVHAAHYQLNYWNDADDYLIARRRIHVPEKGTLFFTRGVMGDENGGQYVENLEVFVSTKTNDLNDFHLVKRFSFADYLGEQHMEEVDLSQYAGKDIYLAFRVCSDKMQNDLWLWDVMVTQKLDTPQNVKLERTADDQLTASWDAVKDADLYYLCLSKETSEPNSVAEFAPMSAYHDVKGDVTLGMGTIKFTGTGSVTLKEYPEGLQKCMFILTTSGPLGTSELSIEGTEDGKTWNTIGTKFTLSEYDSDGQEGDLTNYLEGKKYKQLRFNFKYGGRTGCIKYLSLVYNDGLVYEDLAAGAVRPQGGDVQKMPIRNTKEGEFDEGKYRVWVAAGKMLTEESPIYYDESKPAYYDKETATGIQDVIEGTGIGIRVDDNQVLIDGIKPGYVVSCVSASGAQIYSGVSTSSSLGFHAPSGVAVISVSGEGKAHRAKIIIK
mgnify:CR=1 FL=1